MCRDEGQSLTVVLALSHSGIRQGIEDTMSAWKFVFDKQGLGQAYEPSRTLLVGVSAGESTPHHTSQPHPILTTTLPHFAPGSQFAVQLLLRLPSPTQHPCAFLNMYGAVSVDVEKYRQPIPSAYLPHPLLDLPDPGFPPLNMLAHHLFVPPKGAEGKENVMAWPVPYQLVLKKGLPQCTGSPLSFIDEHLAKGRLDPAKCDAEWHDNQWVKRNGLPSSTEATLYDEVQAGRRMAPEDIARALLMWLGFRQGTFLQMMCDLEGGEGVEELLDNIDLVHRLEADVSHPGGHETKGHYAGTNLPPVPTTLPPTYTVHGTSDELLPLWVSEKFHDLLQRKGVESTLRVVQGVDHGFDSLAWGFEGGEGEEEVRRMGEWVRGKLGV